MGTFGQRWCRERRGRALGRALAGLGACAAAALLSACGWTARDDFFERRAMSLDARTGDGSRLTWATPTDPRQAITGMDRVAQAAEFER